MWAYFPKQRIQYFPRHRSFVHLVRANVDEHGMILAGETLLLGENLALFHTGHHKPRID